MSACTVEWIEPSNNYNVVKLQTLRKLRQQLEPSFRYNPLVMNKKEGSDINFVRFPVHVTLTVLGQRIYDGGNASAGNELVYGKVYKITKFIDNG